MTTRNSKRCSEQILLGNKIERNGVEMAPCSRCERVKRRCVVLPSTDGDSASKRCAECARQGRSSCDYVERNRMPSVSDWTSLDRQLAKLDEEEERAIAVSQEAMAKILRLRKEKAFLKARERKMIEAGLGSLDELDAAEEKERLEKEQAEQAPPEANPSEVDPSIFELPPMSDSELSAWLAAEGSSGGIPPDLVGSSNS
ncbi:hypothetical protein CJF32_00008237 [Rutstroemia sp. NJR-2017a WRK4]|nr:hypothetical protein CJF32_00008237 [Rutstroemia sp. NJR-2017a WRK4]